MRVPEPDYPPAKPCPGCGLIDDVVAITPGSLPHGFICGPCNLIFTGSDQEWHNGGDKRQKAREKRAAARGIEILAEASQMPI